jgi:hypothetical protein
MKLMRLTALIWQIASPKWDFDDATLNRSAAPFDNPDHVSIVIHNYRWRLDEMLSDSIAKPREIFIADRLNR